MQDLQTRPKITYVLYCGDSPKYFIKWISTDEEEIKAINDGWVLVREDKENKR